MATQRLLAASGRDAHESSYSYGGVLHCDVLGQVWQKVPIVWKAGLSVVRAVPCGHRSKS